MNSRRKAHKHLLALGVVLLFGSGTALPRFESAQGRAVTTFREREPRPDRPDEAMKFRRLQLQDERGFIPPDGLKKAKQHVALMKAAEQERKNARQRSPQALHAAGIEPDSWEWLGPGNIGGRIRSLVIHPNNPLDMWVGSISGGIWRTALGGAAWFPVDDFMANLAVSTMVINPANPNIIYAGTGEGSFETSNVTTDLIPGAGVFRSTDTGVTWNQLPGTLPNPALCGSPTICSWLAVNRLAISPNGNTILAGENTGLWESTNGGDTWTQRISGLTIFDVDIHPTDSQQAIAGGDGKARVSTDGGQHWTDATFSPAISGRVELAYAPSSPNIIYASVDQNQGEVYRSTNGGQTYTRVNTGTNYLGSLGYYANIIWVNPQNANFVIVGGINLWRSTNGGTSFSPISRWEDAPQSAHADHHMIVAPPNFNNDTNRRVYFCNDGGVYRTDDVAAINVSWVVMNNNLGITQFYGGAGNAATGLIVGGTQDNGIVKFVGGAQAWETTIGGDGGFCAADPTNGNLFYGESTELAIFRSTNNGQFGGYIYCNPSQINPPTDFICDSMGITDAHNGANFVAPFVLDPNDSDTMLAGGLRLWRSINVKDAIPTWRVIKEPTEDNSPISAIAISPLGSSIICVGHNNGYIYFTSNGTADSPIWTKIDTATLPKRFVTRVVIDANRSPTWIYATFGGFKSDNIYRTTNFGSTWVDVSGTGATGLPFVPVRSLVYHPRNHNLLYAGTEIGIFTSDDAGAHWEPTQDGPANVSVDELFWLIEDLIAVTWGRGLYRASGGVYVDCNYIGFELGTFNAPYRTIRAAVNATTRYQAIWIKPCNYNETFIMPPINRRLEMRSLGGTATIGSP